MDAKTRKSLARRYRKVSWGRLYWNYRRGRYREMFDSDDVCVVRDAPYTDHYKTIEAFIERLEYAERWAEK